MGSLHLGKKMEIGPYTLRNVNKALELISDSKLDSNAKNKDNLSLVYCL